jgi:hypothetical protein
MVYVFCCAAGIASTSQALAEERFQKFMDGFRSSA